MLNFKAASSLLGGWFFGQFAVQRHWRSVSLQLSVDLAFLGRGMSQQ